MNTQNAATLVLGGATICFATLALTRTTEAQGGKIGSAQLSQMQQAAKMESASTSTAPVSHLALDDKFLWVAQGSTVFRIDRDSLSVLPVPLKATPTANLSGIVEPVPKSGIRSILKGGGGG